MRSRHYVVKGPSLLSRHACGPRLLLPLVLSHSLSLCFLIYLFRVFWAIITIFIEHVNTWRHRGIRDSAGFLSIKNNNNKYNKPARLHNFSQARGVDGGAEGACGTVTDVFFWPQIYLCGFRQLS